MSEHVSVERQGAVEIIRMNRPDKKNAITRAMYGAMAAALTAGDADADVRCRVMLGLPGAFSAGNDLADFLTVAQGGEGGNEVFDFLLALATGAKPIVSGADGIAVGIGTTMHLHCDLTFATPRTLFRTPFVELGIVPEAGSSLLLPRLIGRQQAFAMLAMGEAFSAERAKAVGLIYEVVAEDELEQATLAAARRIADLPPEAMRLTRDLMVGPRDELVARVEEEGRTFRRRLTSDEARNAFLAFMNRKKG